MATKRLSMRQTREMLRQKFLLGRSHRDIAGSLGLSVGAVGMNERRQLRILDRLALIARRLTAAERPTDGFTR